MYTAFSRVLKENNYEGWIFYPSDKTEPIDAAVVVFGKEVNRLYWFSNSPKHFEQEDCSYFIMNLVHDLDTEFELYIKLRQKPIDGSPFCELLDEVDTITSFK